MQFAQTIFMVSFATLLAFVSTSSIFGHDSDIGLLNFMARSNDLLQQDPTRSLDCFNKYIPLINEIANTYETNFKACLNDSEAASAKADEATLEQRNQLANAAESSCSLLKQCPESQSVEGVFQCYIDGGSNNIQTMYLINSNASQELAALREQYYLIKNSEYKCTNETKRVYEKKSAEAYAGLNNCILGNEAIVTKEPSTTAQPTTQTTTETTPAAPETTSAAQETSSAAPETSSAAPETTESPVTITNIPESTVRAPEESTTENSVPTTENASEPTVNSSSESVTAPVEPTTESPEESTSVNPEQLEDYNY